VKKINGAHSSSESKDNAIGNNRQVRVNATD